MTEGMKVGVIATIQKFLDNVGIKSFTRADVHAELVKAFPERDADKMMSTVKTQITGKMSKERGYIFANDGENFIVIPPSKKKILIANKWNLFEYAPRKCYHPALRGLRGPGWVPVTLVRDVKENVIMFNLNYIVDAAASGVPGSGFAYTPFKGVHLVFDSASDEWHMTDPGISYPDWIYRFALPDAKLQKFFDDNRQHIPPLAAMQELIADIFR
jgi:hypothetical protein